MGIRFRRKDPTMRLLAYSECTEKEDWRREYAEEKRGRGAGVRGRLKGRKETGDGSVKRA
jgi:hypothetical protein